MPPKFLYFDLGKVLVDFDVAVMCRQMADVAGILPQQVQEAVFAGGLLDAYESGRIDDRGFYEGFCQATNSAAEFAALARAGTEIFSLKLSMLPIIAQLHQAGYRLGVLSNTSSAHWRYVFNRFRILREFFSVNALSYEIGVCKPNTAIFQRAAALAGCRPEEIFYTDDIPGHIAGGRAAGLDAVLFTSAAETARELRQRGVRFNY